MIEKLYPRLPEKDPKKFELLNGVFEELTDAIIQCYLLDQTKWSKGLIWRSLRDYSGRVIKFRRYDRRSNTCNSRRPRM